MATFTFAQQLIPAGSIAIPSEYEITNIEELNSSQLDYCAVPFRNGIVFTSTRNSGSVFGCSKDFLSGHYSDLYYAEKDREGSFQSPRLLEGEVNGKYHDGACTFVNGQTEMIFSRNNRKGTNKWGMIDLKIYGGEIKSGLWENVKELPFNSDEFATCHPSSTPNGVWLYFASDRPGGFGGMDIYVVQRKEVGWGQPVNLGSKVNTSSNEIFPFISSEGILYWSSEGFGGMGGLDIYALPISNGEAAIRSHLTAPINSTSDDFAFSTNFEGTDGFLTSNREGGFGKDDLYSWKFLGQKPQMANICVVDEKTGERILDAYLDLKPLSQGINGSTPIPSTDGISFLQMQAMNVAGKEYLVLVPYEDNAALLEKPQIGKSCDFHYPIIAGRKYQVTVDKPGYLPLKRTVTAEEILTNEEWLIPIRQKPPIAMSGEVKDKNNHKPIPFADVKVINSCNGKEHAYVADRQGTFTFPMDCNCDYEVMASKGSYHYDYEVIYSYDIQCEDENTTVLLYLEKEAISKKPEPEFEVGMVLKLEDLYYDYDKFAIRSDASIELDRVVEYMLDHPSLEIELRSHTDSRGTDEYNRVLSQRRAESAVEYIVSRGIQPSRLKAAGYGETQLVNNCRNGADCSDSEHQENRRTEIKVTKFNEKGYRIEK